MAAALEIADETQPGGSVQPSKLVVTVYGLYSRADGGWLSVAALVSLLADLGIDEPAVRSSISRLKRRGILVAVRRNAAAGYELSTEALAILREGDARIFSRERATLADGWVLAVFSVPETERNKRHILRSQLTSLGFGNVASGVWIAPAHLYETTSDMLNRLGLTANATLFRADHLAFGDVADKVRQWWDLDQLTALYETFLDQHAEALRRWQRRRIPRPAEAFADYVRVLTDWRQLPYLDPGLPAELLPTHWIGIRAADLFATLRGLLEEPARAHVHATTTPKAQ